jgi:hypothetical protein
VQRDPADLQHVRQVRHPQRQRGVLLGQQHRRALPVDLRDHLADPVHQLRRQTQRRLVQQEQPRAGHQRPADREQLLLAAGQQPGPLVTALPQHRQQVVDPIAGRPAGPPRHGQTARAQVLLHGQAGEDLPPLGHLHNAGADDRRGVGPVEPAAGVLDRPRGDRPADERQGAGDRAQQRALAGAVAAEHRHDRTVRHGQGHLAQGPDDTGVPDVQPVHGQQRWLRTRHRRAGRRERNRRRSTRR